MRRSRQPVEIARDEGVGERREVGLPIAKALGLRRDRAPARASTATPSRTSARTSACSRGRDSPPRRRSLRGSGAHRTSRRSRRPAADRGRFEAGERAASACARTNASRSCRRTPDAAPAALPRPRRRSSHGPACSGTGGRRCRARCSRSGMRAREKARASRRAGEETRNAHCRARRSDRRVRSARIRDAAPRVCWPMTASPAASRCPHHRRHRLHRSAARRAAGRQRSPRALAGSPRLA